MSEKIVESILGIPVFKWSGWNEADEQGLIFLDCEFLIEELKRFDGCTIEIGFMKPEMTIFEPISKEHETDIIASKLTPQSNFCNVNLLVIPEFMNKLNEKSKSSNANKYEFVSLCSKNT